MTSQSINPRDLLLLTLIIAIFYGIMLGSRPLAVPDEGRYAEVPREMVLAGDYITPRLNAVKYFEKPVLFYWLQSAAIKSFGYNLWSLRLSTALFGLLGCLVTYMGATRLFDRRTGIISSLILSTGILYYGMAHLITLDMTVSTLLSATLLCFIVGTRSPPGHTPKARNTLMYLMYIFAALATLTKGLIGIALPGLIICTWIIVFNQWKLLKTVCLPTGTLLFLAIAAPWHVLVQLHNPEFFNYYFIKQQFARYATLSADRYKPLWWFVPIIILGFYPWIVWLPQALSGSVSKISQFKADPVKAFLILWAGLLFIFFSISNSKLIPYIVPIFTPLAILLADFFNKKFAAKQAHTFKKGAIALLVFTLLIAIALIIAPRFTTFSDLVTVKRFIACLAAILVIGASVASAFLFKQRITHAFIILNISMAIFLVTLNASLPYLDDRSIRPLALELNKTLQPDDEVISYGTYFQDLPPYIHRTVSIVGWKNELRFGMHQEDTSGWMIDRNEFLKRWNSKRRIYVMTSKKHLRRLLKKHPDFKFRLIKQNSSNLLLVNQEHKS